MTPDDIRQWDDYRGSTPMPEDFRPFWEARMAEADQVPLDYTITPSEIPSFESCDYLDLWFTGFDGGRIYAKYLRPRSDGPVPLVCSVLFHKVPYSLFFDIFSFNFIFV